MVRFHVLMVCRETATEELWFESMCSWYVGKLPHLFFFFRCVAGVRAGACRRNGDGVRLLCGIRGRFRDWRYPSLQAIATVVRCPIVLMRRSLPLSPPIAIMCRTRSAVNWLMELHRRGINSCSSVQFRLLDDKSPSAPSLISLSYRSFPLRCRSINSATDSIDHSPEGPRDTRQRMQKPRIHSGADDGLRSISLSHRTSILRPRCMPCLLRILSRSSSIVRAVPARRFVSHFMSHLPLHRAVHKIASRALLVVAVTATPSILYPVQHPGNQQSHTCGDSMR